MQPANVVTVRMVNGLQPNQPTIGHRNCTPLSSMLFPATSMSWGILPAMLTPSPGIESTAALSSS